MEGKEEYKSLVETLTIGKEEYESLVETLNILSDDDAMAAIAEAKAELEA